jgi:hypothetical protein
MPVETTIIGTSDDERAIRMERFGKASSKKDQRGPRAFGAGASHAFVIARAEV